MVYHQLLHAVVHESVGEVTAQFLRQFVVTLASDFLHDGIAPLSGHVGEIVLYFFRRENPFIAHLDVVLCRFGVPFSRYLECLVRVGERLARRRHHAEYAAYGSRILLHFLALLLGQVGLRLRHDGDEMMAEITAHEGLYFRKPPAMFDFVHIINIFLYHVYLFQQLFLRLFDGVVVHFHLLGEKLFEPCIFFDTVLNEAYRLFPFDFHRGFPFFPVVEPCFRPPADSGAVGIDGDNPRYVETLDVDVQLRQRVDESAARYSFVMKFFLPRRPLWRGTPHAAGQGSSGNPLSAGSELCRQAAWLCAPVRGDWLCSAICS